MISFTYHLGVELSDLGVVLVGAAIVLEVGHGVGVRPYTDASITGRKS